MRILGSGDNEMKFWNKNFYVIKTNLQILWIILIIDGAQTWCLLVILGTIYDSINLTPAIFSERNYTDLLWQRRGIKASWNDYFIF